MVREARQELLCGLAVHWLGFPRDDSPGHPVHGLWFTREFLIETERAQPAVADDDESFHDPVETGHPQLTHTSSRNTEMRARRRKMICAALAWVVVICGALMLLVILKQRRGPATEAVTQWNTVKAK